MSAYYNEIDPIAAQWLRNLIAAGHIAPGDVDERDIRDIQPDELADYTQCHFFAGIGIWSHSLRNAGWPDDRPVWTGSCPCQPFSAAGARGGITDERHLWPHWFHLIECCRPVEVFGEQVASKDGLGWLDLVSADMEGTGYAFGAVDMCAAGVGAPHIRQRLWFHAKDRLADVESIERAKLRGRLEETERREGPVGVGSSFSAVGDALGTGRREPGWDDQNKRRSTAPTGCADRLADALPAGRAEGWAITGDRPVAGERAVGGLEHPGSGGWQRRETTASGHVDDGPTPYGPEGQHGPGFASAHRVQEPTVRTGPVNGFWRNADWLGCTDGKWRPVRSGTFPLADGVAGRVGRLRAYGNGIVAPAAEAFIAAAMKHNSVERKRVKK